MRGAYVSEQADLIRARFKAVWLLSKLATSEFAPDLFRLLLNPAEDSDVRYHARLGVARLGAPLPAGALRRLLREEFERASGRPSTTSAHYAGDESFVGDVLMLARGPGDMPAAIEFLECVPPEVRAGVLAAFSARAYGPRNPSPELCAWLYGRWLEGDRALLEGRDRWPTNLDVALATEGRRESREIAVDEWRGRPTKRWGSSLFEHVRHYEMFLPAAASEGLFDEAADRLGLPADVMLERFGRAELLRRLERVIVSADERARAREYDGTRPDPLGRAFELMRGVPGHRAWAIRLLGRRALSEVVMGHLVDLLWGSDRERLVRWALGRGRAGGGVEETRPVLRRVSYGPRRGDGELLSWALASDEPSLRYLAVEGLLSLGPVDEASRRRLDALAFGVERDQARWRAYRQKAYDASYVQHEAASRWADDDEFAFDGEAYVRLRALGALGRLGSASALERLAFEATGAPTRRQRCEAVGALAEARPAAYVPLFERVLGGGGSGARVAYDDECLHKAAALALARAGSVEALSALVRAYASAGSYEVLFTLRDCIGALVERFEGRDARPPGPRFLGRPPAPDWLPIRPR